MYYKLMAGMKTEMPPLHAAEAGGGGGGGGGAGNTGGGGNAGSSSNIQNGNANANNSSSNGGGGGPNATTTTTTASSIDAIATSTPVGGTGVSNTISAAADSSDNQPGTPQPMHNQLSGNEQQQQQQQQSSNSGVSMSHHPYHMYGTAVTTNTTGSLPHMYSGVYATAGGHDMQQQSQQQQQQHAGYPSYLNSYEQFYQQQQQTGSGAEYGNNAPLMYGGGGGSHEYKAPSTSSSVRYHPYLQTPTSCGPSANAHHGNDAHDAAAVAAASAALPLANSSTAVSTTTNAMSPRVVSSSSPTSTSSHLQLSGNSVSPGSCKLQCKKCGIMCANESELQEHITNVHGASPYGSSGYSSSPYIKEELSSASQQQGTQQGGNPGDILDLDSQKMVYPPAPGSMQAMLQHPHQMHDATGANDPLHSMHNMQQRALPGWDQSTGAALQEGLPTYMQQQQQQQPQQSADIGNKPPHAGQSPYYSPKQSPYHVSGGGGGVSGGISGGSAVIKHEYPLIKSEYADSQNYVDKSFDPTVGVGGGEMCQQPPAQQQTQQMMPVSSSPAEFPSTTTGPQDQSGQYRGFEPPTSSSVLPANSITAKAATWKSNEARRPKTYNCTACNKWFTSSGHLKRHYNTTLHKNAVKSSGQPDPATLPISAHHHPAREPGVKHSRRNNAASAAAAAAAAAQQQPPAPVQPPEPPRSPPDFGQAAGLGQMSHYSASPSPTQQQQQANGMSYGQTPNGYQQQQQYMQVQQAQSSTNAAAHAPNSIAGASPNAQTVLNGHPNGLAGPSAPTTTPPPMPSSHTRGLLNKTTTTITIKSEPMEDNTLTLQQHSPMDMAMEALQQQQQQQLEEEAAAAAAVAAEQQQLRRRHLPELPDQAVELGLLVPAQAHHYQRQQQSLEALEEQQRQFHSSTPSSTHSMGAQSPLIISHQQYQEQLQAHQQQMGDSIFSHTPPPQPQAVHMPPASIMDPQYSIIPLGISTQPPHSSSMPLLQQPPHTTTSTATTSMGSIHMLHSHHHQQQPELTLPPMPSTLLSSTSIQSPLDTISTTITPPRPLPTTTTPQQLQPLPLQQQQHTTNTIPSFQQLQQASGLAPLEPTMTYHTIIGNSGGGGLSASGASSEMLQISTLDSYGNLQPSQMLATSDGHILQFLSTGAAPMMGQSLYTLPTRETYASLSSYTAQRSPQEGDLPPAHTIVPGGASMHSGASVHNLAGLPAYSPRISSSTLTTIDEYTIHNNDNGIKQELMQVDLNSVLTAAAAAATEKNTASSDGGLAPAQKKPRRPNTTAQRKRNNASTTGGTTAPAAAMLPTGRIKCLECNKEFTKNCYLTQHNKSFHSGEYPYRCTKCGKRFQSEEVYTTHLGRHKTVDKPHKCDLCPKQFHHKTDLRRHIEAIHTGMKQHVCDICEKSFCRMDHLRKHIDTHNRPRVMSKKMAKRMSAQNDKFAMTAAILNASKKIEGQLQLELQAQSLSQSQSQPQSPLQQQQQQQQQQQAEQQQLSESVYYETDAEKAATVVGRTAVSVMVNAELVPAGDSSDDESLLEAEQKQFALGKAEEQSGGKLCAYY